MPSEPDNSTKGEAYAQRLVNLESARWKRILDVQRPYRWNLRRLHLGRTLDVGCGIGRNLVALAPGSVGVDHNASSIDVARSRGLTAYTSDEFFAGDVAREGQFDALLAAHVIEHMTPNEAGELLTTYLPFVRPGGLVLLICPQERGYTTDSTHVTYFDAPAIARVAESLGLRVQRSYSFPLLRPAGRVFPYNEFCVLSRKPH